MPDAPKVSEKRADWQGQVSNADPHDLPLGANVEQVNISNIKAGQLTVRDGFREVEFDN